MKHRIQLIQGLAYFIVLLLIQSYVFAQNESVDINLRLEKQEYLEGEILILQVSIKNKGDHAIPFLGNSVLKIRSSSGEILKNNLLTHFLPESIEPGATKEIVANLNGTFGLPSRGNYPYLPSGTYEVYVDLANRGILSQFIPFVVIKPQGTAKKLFEEFLTGRESLLPRSSANIQERFRRQAIVYNRLTKKLTNTNYDPLFITMHLHFLSQKKQSATTQYFNLCDLFINNFKQSFLIKMVLKSIVSHYKYTDNKQGAIDYFANLKGKQISQELQDFIDTKIMEKINKL